MISSENLIYTLSFLDKSGWPDGPWKLEPDKMLWKDEKTGYLCLMRRVAELTHHCGYVGVTKDHPLWRTQLLQFRRDKVLLDYFQSVHGFITMAYPGKRFESEPGPHNKIGIAPVEGLPNPEDIWWIGIDMVQNEDVVPIIADDPADNNPDRTYRDLGFLVHELQKLSELIQKFKSEFEDGTLKFDRKEEPDPNWAM